MNKHGNSMENAGKYYPGGEPPKRDIGDDSSAYGEAEGTMTVEEQIAGYQAYIDKINRRVKAGDMPTKDELLRRDEARAKMDALLVKSQFPQ
jgi:hypothetical protein